jgi:hypothetical protein
MPFLIEKDGPHLEGVRLECELVLPASYCRLNSTAMFSTNWDREREWQAEDRSIEATPTGYAFSSGKVDWGQGPTDRRCTGPFVQAYLRDDAMIVRPVRRVWLTVDGTGLAETDMDGPELQLDFGRALLASLLSRGDRADASFRTGVGHVDGQTGRSVGECGGPMRQDICRLDLTLDRDAHELRIEGEAELEPLAPALAASVGSLGPKLQFSFALSRTWLLARGIELPRFWDDWKRELGVNGVW